MLLTKVFHQTEKNKLNNSIIDNEDTRSECSFISSSKKRKQSHSLFLESATSAFNQLAKSATSAPEDQWDIFGKDVVHVMHGLADKDIQRHVTFAI